MACMIAKTKNESKTWFQLHVHVICSGFSQSPISYEAYQGLNTWLMTVNVT